MAAQYTEEQRTSALAALETSGGNVSRLVRETGIPRSTVRRWWDEHRAVATGAAMAAEETGQVLAMGERWAAVQALATATLAGNLQRYNDSALQLEPHELKDVAVIAGISADKHLDYTQGRKGQQTSVNIDQRKVELIYRDTPRLDEG